MWACSKDASRGICRQVRPSVDVQVCARNGRGSPQVSPGRPPMCPDAMNPASSASSAAAVSGALSTRCHRSPSSERQAMPGPYGASVDRPTATHPRGPCVALSTLAESDPGRSPTLRHSARPVVVQTWIPPVPSGSSPTNAVSRPSSATSVCRPAATARPEAFVARKPRPPIRGGPDHAGPPLRLGGRTRRTRSPTRRRRASRHRRRRHRPRSATTGRRSTARPLPDQRASRPPRTRIPLLAMPAITPSSISRTVSQGPPASGAPDRVAGGRVPIGRDDLGLARDQPDRPAGSLAAPVDASDPGPARRSPSSRRRGSRAAVRAPGSRSAPADRAPGVGSGVGSTVRRGRGRGRCGRSGRCRRSSVSWSARPSATDRRRRPGSATPDRSRPAPRSTLPRP